MNSYLLVVTFDIQIGPSQIQTLKHWVFEIVQNLDVQNSSPPLYFDKDYFSLTLVPLPNYPLGPIISRDPVRKNRMDPNTKPFELVFRWIRFSCTTVSQALTFLIRTIEHAEPAERRNGCESGSGHVERDAEHPWSGQQRSHWRNNRKTKRRGTNCGTVSSKFTRLDIYISSTVTIWIPNTFILIPDSMDVPYSNGKVTWLGGPFGYQTFWTIKILFQSSLINIRVCLMKSGECQARIVKADYGCVNSNTWMPDQVLSYLE